MATNFDIEKFDGRNDFNLWRVRMKALLVQQGLSTKALEGKEKLSASLKEDEKEEIIEKARSAIQLHLSDEVLRKVEKEDTASKLWLKLENLYGSGHVENCRSCSVAYKAVNLTDVLKVASIALIGIVAAASQDAMSTFARTILVALAVILYALSIWLT